MAILTEEILVSPASGFAQSPFCACFQQLTLGLNINIQRDRKNTTWRQIVFPKAANQPAHSLREIKITYQYLVDN
jgi:hypothetical protein